MTIFTTIRQSVATFFSDLFTTYGPDDLHRDRLEALKELCDNSPGLWVVTRRRDGYVFAVLADRIEEVDRKCQRWWGARYKASDPIRGWDAERVHFLPEEKGW